MTAKGKTMVRGALAGLVLMIGAGLAAAQPAWVQLEALNSLDQAEARMRSLSATFPEVAGYALSGGWYAVTLGPFASPEEAYQRLQALRGEGLIPADSYVADGSQFRTQFWPVGAALALAPQPVPETPTTETPATEAAAETPATAAEPVETLADAQRAEAALSREERMDIQSALQWLGLYSSKIDGAFGRGTRASIATWQEVAGVEPTGVLRSAERAQLLATVAAERAALGLTAVEETAAGIAIELPLGLVEFDHYDPPFVHFREKNGSGVTVLLISQPGDQNTLFGLYDAMQTLEIVPMTGPRERGKQGFTLSGESDRIHSHSVAKLSAGLIKGFTLVYPANDAPRMARVLEAMKTSFKPMGETALDPTLGKPMEVSRADLLSGLDVRRPEFAQSGFFIDAKGTVLTAASTLGQCGQLTIDAAPARLALHDPASGLAVLTPETPLAPQGVAAFAVADAGIGAAVSVAGYSYPEALSAPVMSFGTLSERAGLAGEPTQARLAMATLPGDVGGPVLDGSGAVLGLVLPQPADPGKLFPPDMTLALQATAAAPVLAAAGFAPDAAEATGTLAIEDVSALARRMTVQVKCWK